MFLTLTTLDDSIASDNLAYQNSFLIPVLIGLLIIALLITGLLVYSIYFNNRSVFHTNVTEVDEPSFQTQSKFFFTDNEAQTAAVKSSALNDTSESRKNRRRKDIDEIKSMIINADPLRAWESKVNATSNKVPGVSPTPIPDIPVRDGKNSKIEFQINTKADEQVENEIKPQMSQIGYTPSTDFRQTETPLYPFAVMPNPYSKVKYPQQGKTGRRGYSEKKFKDYLTKHFSNDFIIGDDHYLLVRGQIRPYEPDFSLIDKLNRNILIDIEIDEPYQGINDIVNRKPTHYVGIDDERNTAFTKRGWIVIRFAEIQVHQSPDSCCRFVADVLKTIIREYRIPKSLKNIERPAIINQWTKLEAILWSSQRYREKYLSIADFGYTEEKILLHNISETEHGEAIEDLIEEKVPFEIISNDEKNSGYDHVRYQIKDALYRETYLLIDYNSLITIVKPITCKGNYLEAFCFVKNTNIDFKISQIKNTSLESDYYLERFNRPTRSQVNDIFDLAQSIKKPLRVKYISSNTLDKSTGELINIYKFFTISNMKQVEDGVRKTKEGEFKVKNGQHFDATNHAYGSTITLRYDRISEIELLNI